MNSRLITPVGAAGIGFTVLVILLAVYFVASTPSSLLGNDLVKSSTPATDHAEIGYTLPSGRSAGDVGKDLEKLGIIKSGQQFEFMVGLMGVQSKLGSGDYLLKKNSSVLTVVSDMTVREQVPVLKVTFPEGIRVEEMAVIAEKAGFGSRDDFMAAVARAQLPPGFVESHPEGTGVEGYLFPDTYIMRVGSTPDELIAYMLDTLQRRFTPELRTAAQSHGLNPHQALTLASIVEREAVDHRARLRLRVDHVPDADAAAGPSGEDEGTRCPASG